MLQRRDELGKDRNADFCSSINGAGVVFAGILVKANEEEDGGAEGSVTELGAAEVVVLHSSPKLGTVFSPKEQWQIISNAHEPFFLLLFIIYFPIFYYSIHKKYTLCACSAV